TANEASCSERERCEERDRPGAAEVELAFSIGAAERDSVVQASRNLSFPEVLVSADVLFGFGTGVEEHSFFAVQLPTRAAGFRREGPAFREGELVADRDVLLRERELIGRRPDVEVALRFGADLEKNADRRRVAGGDADAERIDFFEPVRDRERFVDAHLAASDARADVECALGGICGRCDRHQHEDEWKRSHRVDLPCSCTPEDDAKLGACPARLQGWAFECRKTVLRGSDLATSTAGAAQRRRIDPTHEYSCLTRAPSPEPQNVRHCMSETAAIIEALKRDLKRRGLTYRDLAKKVGLSEASVKRVFASKSFTLQRL